MTIWSIDAVFGEIFIPTSIREEAITLRKVEVGIAEGCSVDDFRGREFSDGAADDHGSL